MNFSMLHRIQRADHAFVATVVRTEGHTYRKSGAKALFREGDPIPLFGNLGSLCADQELVDQGGAACREGRPRVVRIDTTSAADADVGYGTYCGGVMEILIEPLSEDHKSVYRELGDRLERDETVSLVHDTRDGRLSLRAGAADRTAPDADDRYVESIRPPQRVFLFGATPLARRIARILEDSEFDAHVVDWRSAYLEGCEGVDATRRVRPSTPGVPSWG
jgi:xanthine dehydrogenase accessory factor